jgi:glutathione S-transferase
MKLYYSPGACSLSPHITLAEAGLPYTIEKVDLKVKKTETGADFFAINPTGYVPALVLDNGEVLSEGPAIVQYLADLVPAKSSRRPPAASSACACRKCSTTFPPNCTSPSARCSTRPRPRTGRPSCAAQILRRLEPMEKRLAKADYLMGEFSVADAYLFTILGWTRLVGIDLKENAVLSAYIARVKARPAVQQAMKEEGLIKPA